MTRLARNLSHKPSIDQKRCDDILAIWDKYLLELMSQAKKEGDEDAKELFTKILITNKRVRICCV